MKKRVIALMLAFVLVLNMGTVAFANGEATPAPVTETEPTPTPAADPTPTSTPAVEATPTPTPTPEVVLASIRVTQMPDKLEYLCTDTVVDSTGGLLTLTFSDRTTQTVDLSVATLSLVKETVNVTYEDMTDSFTVTVKHNYDEGVVTTEATATEPGVMTYTCADCGDEQTGEIPMAVSTDITGTCGDNLTWVLDSDGVLTISGTGMMPEYLDDDSPWLEHRDKIKKIVLGENVTNISDGAFSGCTELTAIEMPGVSSIGEAAFSGCSKLESIAIPNSVSSVGDNAFAYCSSLKDAVLSDSMRYIEVCLFANCTALTSVTIPSGVEQIFENAFMGCSALESVTIPETVEGIDVRAFGNCAKLTSIVFKGGKPNISGAAFSNVTATAYYYKTKNWTEDDFQDYGGTITWKALAEIVASGTCGADGDNLTWTLDSDGVLTISGTGAMANYSASVDTPWNQYKSSITKIAIDDGVTSIGGYAFAICSSLTSIEIPDSMTHIWKSAFSGCSGITSITMPASASIAEDSFNGCTNITNVTLTKGSGLMPYYTWDSSSRLDFYKWTPWYVARNNNISITIEDGVTRIGQNAFNDCSGLTNIKIPDGVTSIESYAFDDSGLTSIKIPNSVTRIGNYAFNGCGGLTSIEIPDSVTQIDEKAFICRNLQKITMPVSASIGRRAFADCPVTNVTLTKGNGTMPNYASQDSYSAIWNVYLWTPWYESTSNDVTVTIEDGVKNIGNYAFKGCDKLTSIDIPASVTSIGWHAFDGCTGLKTAGPKGSGCNYEFSWTDAIPDYAFDGCSGLTSVDIPDSVKSIGRSAFDGCSGLTSIDIPGSVTGIGYYAFSKCTGLTSVEIPEGVISIDGNAFYGCTGLTSIDIPSSLTSIGSGAFYGCTGLKTAGPKGSGCNYEFPWTDAIPDNAFYGCTGLMNVNIPDSVSSIGAHAFSYCYDLTGIEIPDSVTSIGLFAFYYCHALAEITFKGDAPAIEANTFKDVTATASYYKTKDWIDDDFQNYGGTITWKAIAAPVASGSCGAEGDNLTWTLDGDGVLTISGTGAMADCIYPAAPWSDYYNQIKRVVIEDGVTSIGCGAFDYCSALKRITIPSSVTTIGTGAFSDCVFKTAGPIGSGCDYEFGWTTAIPDFAFELCSALESITLPDSITTIGHTAFGRCSSLKSITIPNSLTTIGISAFKGCSALKGITIPDGVVSIGSEAFTDCSILKDITIPNSVTTVGNYAFVRCAFKTAGPIGSGCDFEFGWTSAIPNNAFSGSSLLESIILPDGLTSIGSGVFYDCNSLKSIDIPHSVTSIGKYAFRYCSNLENVSFAGDAPEIAVDAFSDIETTVKYLHAKTWSEDNFKDYGGNLTWQLCCENFVECEIIVDEAVNPTFDSTGLTEGSHCSVCEKPIVAQNELPKLAITELVVTAPNNTVYYKGQTLNTAGLKVVAKLNNNTDMDVTDQVQLEGFSSSAAGTKTITVSFKDAQATFDVQVFSFTSVSLSLEGRVIINFYANFPGYEESGYTPGILFFREQPDGDEIVAAYNAGEGVTSYVVADNGALMFSYDKLAAKELNDKVYATLYAVQDDGKVVFGTPTPISAAEYAVGAFNQYSDEPLL